MIEDYQSFPVGGVAVSRAGGGVGGGGRGRKGERNARDYWRRDRRDYLCRKRRIGRARRAVR